MNGARAEAWPRGWRGLCAAGLLATVRAQVPPEPLAAQLRALCAEVAALPAEAVAGETALQVLDWRTGAPLPRAAVVVVPQWALAEVTWRPVADQRLAQRTWLELAANLGTRIVLDAEARGFVPSDAGQVVVAHGDDHALAWVSSSCVVSPVPDLEIPVDVVDANGRPVVGLPLWGGATDAAGRAVWRLQQWGHFPARHWAIGLQVAPAWGMLPPGSAHVDLREWRPTHAPLRLVAPPTAALELVGVADGLPAEFGHVTITWQPPFGQDHGYRHCRGGAAVRVPHLPIGIPLCVQHGRAAHLVTLSAGKPTRLELVMPADPPAIRYRLVDGQGNVLRGESSFEGPLVLDGERGELLVPASAPTVFVRLRSLDGEEWSCAPFPTPKLSGRGVKAGGDLVLQPSSRVEYCSGRIYDTTWQPVQTTISLGDGSGVWSSAQSDAAGRFRLCLGPWVEGPMGLVARHFADSPLALAGRGDRDVLLVVDRSTPRSVGVTGELLGVGTDPFVLAVGIEARRSGETRCYTSTGVHRSGPFSIYVPPGTYDIAVVQADGAVLVSANGVVAREPAGVAPASLRQPLPPTLRAARLRFVDGLGHPCAVAGLTADASATGLAIVPAGGMQLDLPQILQCVPVQGDRDIVCDPVVVDVAVRGLPAGSAWFFGLGVGAAGSLHEPRTGVLAEGRGRMFVPRGVLLGVRLFAQRYAKTGDLQPPVPLAGFAAGFVVPAAGAPAALVFDAPADLPAQLAALEAAPIPR